MKNREKFAKEILDIACKGECFIVDKNGNIDICGNIHCFECMFKINGLCKRNELIYKWCESEYVEKPKITSREEKFLSLLESKWKYLARGEDKNLYVFDSLPVKEDNSWCIKDESDCCYISKKLFGDMFGFIKWEDDREPWLIKDLKKLEVKDE